MSDERVRNRSGFEDRGSFSERGRRYDDRDSRFGDRERESFDQYDRSPYGSFRGQGYEGGRGWEGRSEESGREFGREENRGGYGESRGGYGRQSGRESGRQDYRGGSGESRGGGYGESRGGFGGGSSEGRGFRGGYSEDESSSRYGRQGGSFGGYGGEYGQYGGGFGGGEDRTTGFAGRRYGSSMGGGYTQRGFGLEPSWGGGTGAESWGSRWGGSSYSGSGGGMGGGWGSFRQERGQFTGRGPKGYQRSDDRVREDVSDALERDGEVDASEIVVTVASGEVTLEGTVPDRKSKRRAEDLIEDLSGVKEVHNHLRVKKHDDDKGGFLGLGKSKEEKREERTAAEKASSDRGATRNPTV